jgi:hypothetical protein
MTFRILLIPVLVVALALAACGGSSSSSQSAAPNPNAKEQSPAGDIPDNQAFVRYTPNGASFSVKVPEGWARSSKGGAVTFTDKLNRITVEQRSGAALKKLKATSHTEVSRRAGRAILIKYTAKAPPNPVTGKAVTDAVQRYVFVHNGRVAVLTLAGPKGADNVDPWRIVTDSLRWSA